MTEKHEYFSRECGGLCPGRPGCGGDQAIWRPICGRARPAGRTWRRTRTSATACSSRRHAQDPARFVAAGPSEAVEVAAARSTSRWSWSWTRGPGGRGLRALAGSGSRFVGAGAFSAATASGGCRTRTAPRRPWFRCWPIRTQPPSLLEQDGIPRAAYWWIRIAGSWGYSSGTCLHCRPARRTKFGWLARTGSAPVQASWFLKPGINS